MGSRRVQGVALLAGLLRAINKRCCQHPPLDPRLFSSSPPLSLYICVYIYFSVFSSHVLFFYFFHSSLWISFLPLSSRDLFFLTRAFSQESSSSLSFSLAVWNSFQSTNSFSLRSLFFSPFFSLSRQSQEDYFSSIFVVLELDFSSFPLDRFHAFRMVSQTLSIRLSFLFYRFESKEFHSRFFLSNHSIFDLSSQGCLEYRPWLHFPSLSFRPWEFSLRASSLELCSAIFYYKLYFYAICNSTRN